MHVARLLCSLFLVHVLECFVLEVVFVFLIVLFIVHRHRALAVAQRPAFLDLARRQSAMPGNRRGSLHSGTGWFRRSRTRGRERTMCLLQPAASRRGPSRPGRASTDSDSSAIARTSPNSSDYEGCRSDGRGHGPGMARTGCAEQLAQKSCSTTSRSPREVHQASCGRERLRQGQN